MKLADRLTPVFLWRYCLKSPLQIDSRPLAELKDELVKSIGEIFELAIAE